MPAFSIVICEYFLLENTSYPAFKITYFLDKEKLLPTKPSSGDEGFVLSVEYRNVTCEPYVEDKS